MIAAAILKKPRKRLREEEGGKGEGTREEVGIRVTI